MGGFGINSGSEVAKSGKQGYYGYIKGMYGVSRWEPECTMITLKLHTDKAPAVLWSQRMTSFIVFCQLEWVWCILVWKFRPSVTSINKIVDCIDRYSRKLCHLSIANVKSMQRNQDTETSRHLGALGGEVRERRWFAAVPRDATGGAGQNSAL